MGKILWDWKNSDIKKYIGKIVENSFHTLWTHSYNVTNWIIFQIDHISQSLINLNNGLIDKLESIHIRSDKLPKGIKSETIDTF
jgi:hypothetical protein